MGSVDESGVGIEAAPSLKSEKPKSMKELGRRVFDQLAGGWALPDGDEINRGEVKELADKMVGLADLRNREVELRKNWMVVEDSNVDVANMHVIGLTVRNLAVGDEGSGGVEEMIRVVKTKRSFLGSTGGRVWFVAKFAEDDRANRLRMEYGADGLRTGLTIQIVRPEGEKGKVVKEQSYERTKDGRWVVHGGKRLKKGRAVVD